MSLYASKNLNYFRLFLLLFILLLVGVKLGEKVPANGFWVKLNDSLARGDKPQVSPVLEPLDDILDKPSMARLRFLMEGKFEPGNLLTNGGFEYYQQSWEIKGADNILPRITAAAAHEGRQSLLIIFPGTDVNFYQAYQEVPVPPARCFHLSAMIRTENLTDGVGLEIWDARGFDLWYGGRTNLVSGTNDWVEAAHQFCPPPGVDRIQVRIRRYGGTGIPVSGSAWFDQVRLTLAEIDQ